MAPRFITKHLSNPTGIGGWLIRLGMNKGNAQENAFALDQLEIRPTDTVMEIGFGGGPNLRRLIEGSSSVLAVDRSSDAVAAATKRFAAERKDGRVRFLLGNVEQLPVADDVCTKALTVHTVYFWRSLELGLAEIRRTLVPGGLLAVGFVPKERMKRMGRHEDIFTLRSLEEVCRAATASGFTFDLRQPPTGAPWVVALCRKPA